MASARTKISREGEVDDFELQVAQTLADLEETSDLKADLRGLQFVSAKEVCPLDSGNPGDI